MDLSRELLCVFSQFSKHIMRSFFSVRISGYLCLYAHICVHGWMHVCVFPCAHMHICHVYLHMYAVSVSACVCVSVRICVCERGCLCAHTCVRVCTRLCVCMILCLFIYFLCAYRRARAFAYASMCTCLYVVLSVSTFWLISVRLTLKLELCYWWV